jgi:ATP-dependent DNA helicase RecG
LNEFSQGTRADFERLLLDKLPDVLDEDKKKNKVKNLLQALKSTGVINTKGKTWIMSKVDR